MFAKDKKHYEGKFLKFELELLMHNSSATTIKMPDKNSCKADKKSDAFYCDIMVILNG